MIPYRLFNKTYWDTQSFLDEFNAFRKEMEYLEEGALGREIKSLNDAVRPPLNIFETRDMFIIRAQVPGLKKDEINLEVAGNSITLSYKKNESGSPKERRYSRRERNIKSFSRLVRLPSEIDSEKIEAGLMNGIITIAIEKAKKAKAKQIVIK